jgi:hypothetical protein
LTVGQFRTALNEEKPVLHVLAEQEKNRVEHYVPLYPSVVRAINEVLTHDFGEKDANKPFFMFNSFEKWLERQKIPLPRVRDPSKAHLWLSDFRKFAEQFGDIIGWDTTNRKYILAHGMTGVDWEHYKHPLPEDSTTRICDIGEISSWEIEKALSKTIRAKSLKNVRKVQLCG